MITIHNKKKIEDIKIVFDAINLNDIYVLRTSNKLIGVSIEGLEIIWEVLIEGENLINLNSINLLNNILIIFSYNRDKDIYLIFGINCNGEIVWRSTSNYRPDGNNALYQSGEKLLFNGYNNSSVLTSIVEIDPQKGEINEIAILKTETVYASNINENILLSGSSGIFLFNPKNEENLHQITDDFLVNIISSLSDKLVYLTESDKEDFYNIVELGKKLVPKIIGTVSLDNSDWGNMSPILVGDKIIKFEGENKGVVFENLKKNEIIWHIGNNKWTVNRAILLKNEHILISSINENFKRNINIHNINTGEIQLKIDFKGVPSKLFNFNNNILIGGSRGLHIYEWSNDII